MSDRQMCRTCFCLGYDLVPVNGEWSCMEHLNGRDAAAEIVRLNEQLAERTLQHQVQLDNAVVLTARLAAAEAELNECRSDLSSTVADWKDAHDGKMIAETAAFFLLEVCKHTDEVRYEQALKHWPFLEEAKGGRDE